MGNWFGDLDLAYKYTVVFVSLLVLTFVAGLIKVFFDRRKLKKLTAQQNEEADVKEERMELNGREKDEGDLFGIRALEAGFYAGIAQSRPTSRAGSVAPSPLTSTSTLVGGVNSPKMQTHSGTDSVSTLPPAHTKDRSYRDSDTLPSPGSEAPPRRASPPAIKLAPSDAELTGRHKLDFDSAVNMNLNIAPSPTANRGPPSPTFSGSDDGDSDGKPSSQRLSSTSTSTKLDHYEPAPPQLPMAQPEGFRASFVSVHEQYKSQTGSLIFASGSTSPTYPETKAPTMPGITLNDGDLNSPQEGLQLLPKTYQPSHQREDSDSSSIYSDRRRSAAEPDLATNPKRKSVAMPTTMDEKRKTLLAPGAPTESRYSEIYDAYYRHSMLHPGEGNRVSRRPDEMLLGDGEGRTGAAMAL